MGVCKYGTSCHFAHGDLDIKKPVNFLILGINSCYFSSIKLSNSNAINELKNSFFVCPKIINLK